jgi:DNA polymerase-1
MNVKIVSSDKDLKQLITDGVVMFDAMKNITTDQKSFQQEYGFHPSSMLDYLTLVGDSSDNIKGVHESEQRSVKLVRVLNHRYLCKYRPRRRKEKLIAGKEQAYASRTLVSLMDTPGCDIPGKTTLQHL